MAATALRDWATRSALPLWASVGFNKAQRRFHERLTLDGRPIVDVPIRLMVQARQIYTYSIASRRGWYPGAIDLVEQAYATMVREYYRADGRDGWVFAVHRDGTVADSKRDLYAHAFVLLGVATFVAATGKRGALAIADETLNYLDAAMCAPQAGGYVDALPPQDATRRQNPHMHLFEGLLALWEVSAEHRYLSRAQEMFELFRKNFFQASDGVLGEYYDSTLRPLAGDAGKIVEPGHHYEWIWLLRRFESASGQDVHSYVEALYSHADRYGYATSGLVVDELLSSGSVRTPSHRAWPVTEAIKANVVEAARGRAGAESKAATLAGLLRTRFFMTDPMGVWIDRLDKNGAPATNFVPASTLYHVIGALDVLHAFQPQT